MAFVVDETFGQYCPDVAPERIAFLHSRAWPNATAVLTRPAVMGIVRAAERAQSVHVRRTGHDGIVAARIVITGPAAALAPLAAMVTMESRTPATRIALHRAKTKTWRDATVQRKYRKNFRLELAAL
jgi:hypothetical protein